MSTVKRMERVRRQCQENGLCSQTKNVPYAPSTPVQTVSHKFMHVAANNNIIALYKARQEHLWPCMPFSTTQITCRSSGLGTMTWKMYTILSTHLGSVSGKRYTIMENGDRQHSISHRFGLELCNGIIKCGNVLGFNTPEIKLLQASSTSHRSKDATGLPLASVSAKLFVGSPEASTTYGNCCHKLLEKAPYTGSQSASVSMKDRAGSPLASAIYHIMDVRIKILRRANKLKSGIG
jgi:hypothetical protein